MYIKDNVDLYITGSNAMLLSSELATLLSGKYIEIKMLPLSFKEYKSYYKNLSNIQLYNKYITFGSFPYTINFESDDDISLYLSSIYNTILLKDIMIRKGISDELMLKSVSNYVLDNVGNLLSTNNIANTMTSAGRKINVRTIEKYYVSDLGLRYFILGRKVGDYGHVLENIVYLELIRRGYEVYIGKVEDYEVDFVAINNEGKTYIQVCETLKSENNSTLIRKLNSLKRINDNYGKIILTFDDVPISNEEGIIIRNVLDWLLDK